MQFSTQHKIFVGIKLTIASLATVVLTVIDTAYLTTYLAVNFELLVVYSIDICTLLYCVCSPIAAYFGYQRKDGMFSTNYAITEIVFSTLGFMCWILICSVGFNVTLRTVAWPCVQFAIVGVVSSVNALLFLTISITYLSGIFKEKVFLTYDDETDSSLLS
ncbi:hypothetical protein M3Y98_00326700 [Aphelenchoides besseyi]|nr:hypothetical protein M3Y98_00326700 [Aphelenchoides besseyi]KAI6201463.1 hypothetical protein M3Y96_00844400 [Aphelenchoides besseyi]